jgi:hypothetical protein
MPGGIKHKTIFLNIWMILLKVMTCALIREVIGNAVKSTVGRGEKLKITHTKG